MVGERRRGGGLSVSVTELMVSDSGLFIFFFPPLICHLDASLHSLSSRSSLSFPLPLSARYFDV